MSITGESNQKMSVNISMGIEGNSQIKEKKGAKSIQEDSWNEKKGKKNKMVW